MRLWKSLSKKAKEARNKNYIEIIAHENDGGREREEERDLIWFSCHALRIHLYGALLICKIGKHNK
jgi:hypothetical protein